MGSSQQKWVAIGLLSIVVILAIAVIVGLN